MLSHHNLVANVYQFLGPRATPLNCNDNILCFLPLYHIYGLNVMLNPALILGATLVLMPRFNVAQLMGLLMEESITMMPLVPPALNALCLAAEAGEFPKNHGVRWVKSGAAPLAPELPRRFTGLTGILVCQGYGMTEASPVTHVGYLERELYRPDSIGHPVAQTECRVIGVDNLAASGESVDEVAAGEPGELVMRGPQFMLGYWKEPDATAAVLRDGWYWSGDIVTRDAEGFYRVVDRRKEMIKYKGFPVAPAEVEAVLLEHPGVRECGVVGRPDAAAGEIPVAFVALREGFIAGKKMEDELCGFVAERLTGYKQPREVHFVELVPKTASGKILRRELRQLIR
jgi:long-chain acyl-CoA synthetase